MKVHSKVVVLAALSAAIALPVWAQQGPGPQTPEQRAERFQASDTNKDGKLDKAEFIAALPDRAKDFADQIWERIDEDADGEVTKEQYVNMQMRPPG